MKFPSYTTPREKLWFYTYRTFCGLVLFFLVAPLIVVIPLSFTNSVFLQFIPEMKIFSFETWSFNFDGYGLRWYKELLGICSANSGTTVCTDPVSYTHLRAHETDSYLVCRLLLEKRE